MLNKFNNNTMDARRKGLLKKFSTLHKQALANGISDTVVRDVCLLSVNETFYKNKKLRKSVDTFGNANGTLKTLPITFVVVGMIMAVFAYSVYERIERPCFVNLRNNAFVMEIKRPLVNCSMCRSLIEVPIERNISIEEFREKYAYTSLPVLIKEATKNWTAMSTFSFNFFRDLYTTTKGALDWRENGCLEFMPYSTEFDSLGAFFNMSEDRANFKTGEDQWYVGWMNCKKEIQTVLRQHYKRPYFLPKDSESSKLDWVFMGWPGLGVPLHLDPEDERPSWQAQISGAKTWTLVPVPECESVCNAMNITVHTGDIIVINVGHWYHATKIEPGEISITIGSGYD